MKIYIGHSNDFNFKEELYMPIMNSKLNEENQFIFLHISDKTFNSKEFIEKSDLFIAEVSRPSLGLGIEIGRAEMKNKKILCIYNEKFKEPSSLKYVNVDILEYRDTEDMICKIEEYIELLGGKKWKRIQKYILQILGQNLD